jgi:hypothetical protein
MLSSRHNAQITKTSNRQGKEKIKPLAVADYNKHRAGVDFFDQRLSYGALEHKTVKWWRKLAFHCIIMAVSNACILHNTIKTKKLSTPKFSQQVCSSMVLSVDDLARADNPSSSKIARLSQHFPDRVPLSEGKMNAQRRCIVCSDKEKYLTGKVGKKDTSYQCSNCNVGQCITPCFKIFHAVMHYEK